MGPPREGDKATFVITDIQGSTALWEAYPDEVRASSPTSPHTLCSPRPLDRVLGDFELDALVHFVRFISFCIQC